MSHQIRAGSRDLDTRDKLRGDSHPVPPSPEKLGGLEVVAFGSLTLAVVVAVIVLPPLIAGGALLGVGLIYLFRSVLLNWTTMLFILVGVILFIPVRRYAVPIPLPFALEPYRMVVAGLLVAFALLLVTRPELRKIRIPFLLPIGVFVASILVAFAANIVGLTQSDLVTGGIGSIFQTVFLLSIAVIVRRLLTSERVVFILLTFIVWGTVLVALGALAERLVKVNVFLLLGNVLPLTLLRDESQSLRAGGARSYASSQHPIALAVFFCMVIPLAIYLAKYAVWPRYELNRTLLYGAGIVIIFGGMLTAVSRTGVGVLAVMFLLILLLRPLLALKLALIALPFVFLGAAIVPKLFDSTVLSFFDVDTLIGSQYASLGLKGQGRLADLAPAFAEVSQVPFFGTGPGSRIVVGANANAFILDSQVLGTLLENGAVGVIGLAALCLIPPIILLARSFRPGVDAKYGLLGVAVALSMGGYVAALFFYDAFSFFQTFMMFMVLLAIGGWLLDEKLTVAPKRLVAGAISR